MAVKYAIVPKEFEKTEASAADAVDGKLFDGPLSNHLAKEALKTRPDQDNYKIVPVEKTGGSLTALPIIETLLGDVSAYIPTNVISITDGQIYLESSLFNAGIRPGINVGISVSRVGGSAQTKAIKQVAARLRMDMASYRELAAFAQFGSDLDKVTQAQLNRGKRLQEILKQPQYNPYSLANQVISLFAATNGFADNIPTEKIRAWETGLLRFMETSYADIITDINQKKQITPETDGKMRQAIQTFNSSWQA